MSLRQVTKQAPRKENGMTLKRSSCGVLLALAFSSVMAHAQTTQITTEYLMTLYAPLDPPQQIDNSLIVYNAREGGWVKGPKVKGTLLARAADWLRPYGWGGCPTLLPPLPGIHLLAPAASLPHLSTSTAQKNLI
jgi:hypothetical protein